jgi:hypothetical protein
MTDESPIEVVVLLEQQDVTRANRDIALGRLTPYKWLVFGISSAVLSAMVAFLVFRQLTGPETVLVGFIGLVGWPAILIGVIHLNSKKAAKSLLQGTPSLQGPTHWLFSDSAIRVRFTHGKFADRVEDVHARSRDNSAIFALSSNPNCSCYSQALLFNQ